MELFNRIGEFARQTASKANDAMEVSKLNAKIRAEKRNIDNLKIQLGDILWNKFSEGAQLEGDAMALCQSIRECNDAIDALNDAVDTIRQEKHTPETCDCESCQEEIDPTQKQCTACGAIMPKSSRFCGHCGAMQED